MANLLNTIKEMGKIPLIALLVLACVPLVIKNEYFLHIFILVMMWSLFGMSWNLLGGYTGQISFGHGAFFGVGAYAALILHFKLGASLWMGFLYGGIAAALIAIPIGALCFRLRGPYFSLSILALSEILRLIALAWRSLTEGAVGFLLIDPVVETKVGSFYLILTLLVIGACIMFYVTRTRAGFYFMAIREEEDSAASLGIPTTRYKLIALIISAFLTGAAGCYFANYTTFIDPYIVFSIGDISIAVVLVALLGGMGTFWGPCIGAVIVVVLGELLRAIFPEGHALAYGILIILVIVFMPKGLLGQIQSYLSKTSSRGMKEIKEGGGERNA